MRPFNPMKKPFLYTAEIAGLVAGAKTSLRTAVSSDSWFELHGISLVCLRKVNDGSAFTTALLTDETTGRAMMSAPVMLADLGENITNSNDGWQNNVDNPYILPVPKMVRPSSILRLDLANIDGALPTEAVQVVYHGVKVFDLGSRDLSPGTAFESFRYVADFGTLTAGAQATVTVPVQSDADFDIVGISSGALYQKCAVGDASDRDSVFLEMQDLATGYLFQDRPVRATLVSGAVQNPYRPIRPLRISKSSGLSVTARNDSGESYPNWKVVFDGYKVYR